MSIYLPLLLLLLLTFAFCAKESNESICSTNKFNLTTLNDQNDNVIPFIINNYKNYFLIVHYDNNTRDNLDDIIKTLNSNCKLLLNYDDGDFKLKRPLGYSFVNLVYLNDSNRFERFSKIYFNLEFNDVIIIFDNNANNFNKNLIGLNRAGSLILYNKFIKKLATIKYYFGIENGTLFDIKYDDKLPNMIRYLNKFNDFNGHRFNVGFAIYRPFVWCKSKMRADNSCDIDGTEATLLNDLSKKYNFQYNLISFVDRPGGDWQEMIKAVYNGKIDWAISGITLTYERTKLADYTSPLRNDPHELLYTIQDGNDDGFNFDYIISSFNWWTWIIIVMMLSVSLTVLKFTSKLFQLRRYSCVLGVIRLMTENPQTYRSFKLSGHRLLLSTLFCYSLLINTFYKSRLTATTIRPKINELNKIKDFLRANYVFQVNNNDWSVLKEFLMSSTDPTYKSLLNHINDRLDYCRALKATLDDRVAFIEEFTYLKTGIVDECLGMFTKEEITSFRLTATNLIPYQHGWAMKLAIPFRHQFSKTISSLTSTGIIDKQIILHNQTATIRRTNERIVLRKERSPIKLRNLFSPFLILIVGHLIAFVTFLIEIILHDKR